MEVLKSFPFFSFHYEHFNGFNVCDIAFILQPSQEWNVLHEAGESSRPEVLCDGLNLWSQRLEFDHEAGR